MFGGRPLKVVRHASARVMRLRVDPRDGSVRLTLPRRASLRHGHAWAEEQRPWVEAQLAERRPGLRLVPGVRLEIGGEPLTLASMSAVRGVRRHENELRVGGEPDLFELRVLRWLKAEAWRVLEAETRTLAAQAGVSVRRVSVGDTRSRWGSCSADGDIRYSWRLILAPSFVRRSTVAHEVAHRVHMNHGSAFKALEEQLLGESPSAARAWLRAHGSSLHGYGRP
ncbi:M48 family metallopeptidase [Sphingomonas sp.]|uniref:M48 family metallopeptidase n=1 Tax=Sphingomonas sp. TaxID=28214 RepID=UPI002DB5D735|nr:YgjP-like metallopeptidase domain-containing protein [Sphingomonas sp.]HEU4969032.1 YgjP-like metallopeptidase domain-containing protein [Sphingomonas sp.]